MSLHTLAWKSNHEQHCGSMPDDDSACVKSVFTDGSTWDVSKMTTQQWRLMPARRAQHGKKEANVCWLGEHAVCCLTTCLRSSSDVKVDVPTRLFCTLRSVSGKGDAEEH